MQDWDSTSSILATESSRITGKRTNGERIKGEQIKEDGIRGQPINGEQVHGEEITGERMNGESACAPCTLFPDSSSRRMDTYDSTSSKPNCLHFGGMVGGEDPL